MSDAAILGLLGVALSAVVGPVWVARIAASARQTAETTRDRLGVPNGQGNVVQMLHRLLDGQTGQDARLARIEGRLHRGDERMADLGSRISAHGDQLTDLDQRLRSIEASTSAIAHHTDTTGRPPMIDRQETP